jgi:hypothetical protein
VASYVRFLEPLQEAESVLLRVKRGAAVWWQVDQGVAYAHDIEGLALAIERSNRCPFVASVLLAVALPNLMPVVMPVWGTMLEPLPEPLADTDLMPALMPMLGTISISIAGPMLNPIVSYVRWFSPNP